LRLWSLVDVFKAARLRDLLLDRGYALLADAARVAAEQRINIDWGFNPQRMLTALASRRPNLRVIVGAKTDPAQDVTGAIAA
jgi:hypothetical protein